MPAPRARGLDAIERMTLALFGVEYLARFWAAAERPGDSGATGRRWRFARSPAALLDLLVIAGGALPLVLPNLAVLRFARLLRIARLARLGRFSRAVDHLWHIVRTRRYELALTAGLAAMLLVLGASAMYWAEGGVQPAKFGSIPRALWWSVVTLTTIGYGDVYPVTPLGKVVAGLFAMAGVGLVALPTGILAAGFREAIDRDRRRGDDG